MLIVPDERGQTALVLPPDAAPQLTSVARMGETLAGLGSEKLRGGVSVLLPTHQPGVCLHEIDATAAPPNPCQGAHADVCTSPQALGAGMLAFAEQLPALIDAAVGAIAADGRLLAGFNIMVRGMRYLGMYAKAELYRQQVIADINRERALSDIAVGRFERFHPAAFDRMRFGARNRRSRGRSIQGFSWQFDAIARGTAGGLGIEVLRLKPIVVPAIAR